MTSDDNLGAFLEQRTGDGDVPAGAHRVRDLLGSASTWADPPPQVLDGVLATIRGERAPAPVAQLNGNAPAPVAQLMSSAPVAPAGARRLPRRRLFTLAAGIAAFGLGAAAGWAGTGLTGGERGDGIELAGTELARDATAEGTVRDTADGVAITLRVDGLPEAAPGRYYAAWLSGPDREPVPLGSFHLRGGGSETIDLWAGVDTTRYDTITVTVESEQEGSGSSGDVVLRGSLPSGG
jgi:anti-sigma-K factor RskA